MNYAELEISLHQRDVASYAAQIRFHSPGQEADQTAEAYPIRFSLDALRERMPDPAAYGELLGQNLLGAQGVQSCLDRARTAARTAEQRLRLRLCIERWSVDLHGLRWETLRDPETKRSLLTDENILFSRHLGSFDMRPVRLRARTALRALVAIANPSDLSQYRPDGRALPPIEVAEELQLAREGLEGNTIMELGGARRATLDALVNELKEDYDVLYLVCHGALIDREPRLGLEDESGKTRVVAGTDLVDGLARLIRLPRLVILASCQSAGTANEARSDDGGALAALGPRLAEAGVPAVIAMQGNVFRRTVAKLMPVFFRELRKDGQIDRAMMEARFAVREQPDYWAPVLYTRLVNGRLWYDQHFGGAPGFDAWPGLINQIRKGQCVPILGSGLLEPFVGSPREIARRWAVDFRYPMARSLHDDLPQVAQYLSTTQGTDYPRDELIRHLGQEVRYRWPALGRAPASDGSQELLALLSSARDLLLQKGLPEAHQILARLSCPLYLTTNPDDLLLDALRSAGKAPQAELCRWREEAPSAAAPAPPPAPVPTVQTPLVYQMFGHLSDTDSLVLTADDYLNFLIGITRMQNRPQASWVLEKLGKSGLIFLGFRIDDWDFRVLVHFLNSQPNISLRKKYKHVAVQLDPEEGLGTDTAQARRFLEKYFGSPEMQIEVYWGSVDDFLQELNKQWQAQP
jgi:hypothetical protein